MLQLSPTKQESRPEIPRKKKTTQGEAGVRTKVTLTFPSWWTTEWCDHYTLQNLLDLLRVLRFAWETTG